MASDSESRQLSEADRINARDVSRGALALARQVIADALELENTTGLDEVLTLMRIAEIGDKIARGPL